MALSVSNSIKLAVPIVSQNFNSCKSSTVHEWRVCEEFNLSNLGCRYINTNTFLHSNPCLHSFVDHLLTLVHPF